MINNGIVLKICQVIDIYDDTDGERIKVKLSPEDDKIDNTKIPYAYPLLPKMLHIKPKVGEFVLVVLTETSNGHSNRYYIGPIISQPQFMEEDSYINRALSLYPGRYNLPDIAPRTNPESHGALANDNDIAIYGRKKTDAILTDSDVRIRCGSRLEEFNENGGIVFNRLDPAYVLLRHTDDKKGTPPEEYRSTATVVADKINLISHQSKTPFRVTDKNKLIADDEMQKIIDTAHLLPYGDILIEFLKIFLRAFELHTHPYPGMTPCTTSEFIEATTYDLKKILSESVRIN